MERPSLALVTQQIAEHREAKMAEFRRLSGHQRRREAVAYFEALQKGEHIFHPYMLALAS